MQLTLKPLNLIFSEQDHAYKLDGQFVPGVTSILSSLAKPFLVPWASKLATETIAEYWKADKKYTKKEISDILYLGKTAHTRKKDEAASSGAIAHAWIEQLIKTNQEPSLPEDKGALNAIQRFQEWLKDNKVEWLASELRVASKSNWFAGTADGLAMLNGKLCLIDFKTSNQISTDYFLQLGAYQICLEEMGSPAIEERRILRFPKTGNDFEDVLVPTNFADDKKAFLAALEIHRYFKKLEK